MVRTLLSAADMNDKRHGRWVATLVAMMFPFSAASAFAQQRDAPIDPERAEILIHARVTADELHFEAVGDASVTFPGLGKRDTLHLVERTNLPTPVTTGVTYRSIGVTVTILTSFADIEAIVREALVEPNTK